MLAAACVSLLCHLPTGQTTVPATRPVTAVRPRPRLLIRPGDLPWIRLRCGAEPAEAFGAPGPLRFGSHLREFRGLQHFLDQNLPLPAEPGGLYPAAFLHLATGRPGVPDKYTRYIDRELTRRDNLVLSFDDVAAALDWCWDALDAPVRTALTRRLLDALQPLAPSDSPFEHLLFHPKLCHLAAAIALQDVPVPGTPDADRLAAVLSAGRDYLSQTLPPLLAQVRGAAPTPEVRANFEADVIFAAELWHALDPAAWSQLREPLADALDVYLWSDTEWPGLGAGVLHDGGSASPLAPGQGESALAPGLADILAFRTRSPVAAYYAALARRTELPDPLRQAHRLWLRILYDWPGPRPVDRGRAPLTRVLGSNWILMRSDWRPGATLVAFDAGQPSWVGRQHLDTGQFQVLRRGRLAIDSGDDISLEAIRPRGGEQRVGDAEADFDLYARSTLAHNCVLLVNPREPRTRVGREWLTFANQLPMADPRQPLDDETAAARRATGRLIAFETNPYYSFATADVAKAYGVKAALVYERSILFVHDGLIVVIDRLETAAPDIRACWLLHLPAAPRVGGEPLDPQLRRRAEGPTAGTWVYPATDAWLDTAADGGRLFARTILPARRRWHFVGGPAERLTVPRGPAQGRAYVGGAAKGFEYWLSPAMLTGGANAWYRLGSPAMLGPAFGAGSGWGRVEVESLDESTSIVFLHLLAAVDHDQTAPPAVNVETAAGVVTIAAHLRGRSYFLRLNPAESPLGSIEVTDPARDQPFRQSFTQELQPNAPLPVE